IFYKSRSIKPEKYALLIENPRWFRQIDRQKPSKCLVQNCKISLNTSFTIIEKKSKSFGSYIINISVFFHELRDGIEKNTFLT
ncbi:unnamed protein product, partial [Heterotrigona itama]